MRPCVSLNVALTRVFRLEMYPQNSDYF